MASSVTLVSNVDVPVGTSGNPLYTSGTATITPSTSTTGTQSNVASSASAVTILAANSNRKGATIVNDSTAILYLILSSTTPTSSVYTVYMAGTGGGTPVYYEVPFNYTGIIQGIWASANGSARVTELT